MKLSGQTLRRQLLGWSLVGLALLAGCSSAPPKPTPAPLEPNVPLLGIRQAWSYALGAVAYPMETRVVGDRIFLASGAGVVVVLDASSGAEVWRADLKAEISAGVGSDGRFVAVVTRANELVVLDEGRVQWRQKLPAVTLTAPLVAGARVFTLSADRTVQAFDARTGQRLWQQQRSGDALVLGQAGLLTAVGDTLVAGLGGRVVGMNPLNGSSRWETPAASPRGTNEVERLVDVVAGFSRDGSQLCVRAFQYAATCLDAQSGKVLWSRPANSSSGLSGDATTVLGTEGDGRLIAWRRADGERLWTSERLRYRALSAPLLMGRSLVVGDESGLLHILSREDASALNRLSTDGSAVRVPPVLAGQTLVVVTAKGGVFAFRPE